MTTEEKALALVEAVTDSRADDIDDFSSSKLRLALYRAIEAHEADKKAFSDAVRKAIDGCGYDEHRKAYISRHLSPFIMPEPEPDPLVEAVQEVWIYAKDAEHMPELRAGQLRQALAARGYKIERIEQ